MVAYIESWAPTNDCTGVLDLCRTITEGDGANSLSNNEICN